MKGGLSSSWRFWQEVWKISPPLPRMSLRDNGVHYRLRKLYSDSLLTGDTKFPIFHGKKGVIIDSTWIEMSDQKSSEDPPHFCRYLLIQKCHSKRPAAIFKLVLQIILISRFVVKRQYRRDRLFCLDPEGSKRWWRSRSLYCLFYWFFPGSFHPPK